MSGYYHIYWFNVLGCDFSDDKNEICSNDYQTMVDEAEMYILVEKRMVNSDVEIRDQYKPKEPIIRNLNLFYNGFLMGVPIRLHQDECNY